MKVSQQISHPLVPTLPPLTLTLLTSLWKEKRFGRFRIISGVSRKINIHQILHAVPHLLHHVTLLPPFLYSVDQLLNRQSGSFVCPAGQNLLRRDYKGRSKSIQLSNLE